MKPLAGYRIQRGSAATGLYVGRLPGRRRFALYTCEEGRYSVTVTPLAYFTSEHAAQTAAALLKQIVEGVAAGGIER